MNISKTFKELIVWQKSVELSVRIYKLTRKFSKDEKFGLVSQLRRACVSIPSNIAEGSKRGTKKDFIQFLRIASGLAAEVETQLIISKQLYSEIDFSEELNLLLEIQKMLTVLIRSIQ